MGKVSYEDKLNAAWDGPWIQNFPQKMETAVGKGFCRLVDERGSAAERNASLAAVDQVTELICSHDEPGTSKSGGRSLTCWISARNLFDVLPKWPRSVCSSKSSSSDYFWRDEGQELERIAMKSSKQVFFTDEKVLYSVSPIIRPIDDQNKKCGGRVRPTRYAPAGLWWHRYSIGSRRLRLITWPCDLEL